MTSFLILLAVVLVTGLLFMGWVLPAWLTGAFLFFLVWYLCHGAMWLFWPLLLLAGAATVFLAYKPLRREFVTRPALKIIRGILPRIGETEQIAIDAGTVWWDGDLFSGAPRWEKLLDFKPQPLSAREQAFLDGPVEEFCKMISDWQIHQDRGLTDEAWAFLKKHGFFGMIIPESYGGLGFSAIAHSAVVAKISSRSVPASIVVMVPNSLGPAELLMQYGTEAQKNQHLPRLASGEDLPCFALTEPHAGSDAAAGRSTGVVCYGKHEGKKVLGLKLNWQKRYITLAPVATLIGLAFAAHDPEGLLGDQADLGITCALIPRGLKGIDVGKRHDPMGVPFPNGPIFGKDVFIPFEYIIGGQEGIGNGWRMLMDCLSAGRSISLPALSVAAVELAARAGGAYGTVREQFGINIGRFEGVAEALARIGGHAYFMDAARTLTCGAVDAGEKPAVISAVVKAYLTEGMRDSVNDAMDVMAGAAICRGPRNILGRGLVGIPIAITVEGANILSRSLIIFGQGLIRGHPFVKKEIDAAGANDLEAFDEALFGHIKFVIRNLVRAPLLALTGGRLLSVPLHGEAGRVLQGLTRLSNAYAVLIDLALATIGGDLKRREGLSGRFADAVAWAYLGSAAVKRYHDEGQNPRDRAAFLWSAKLAMHRCETALFGILDNMPNRPAAWFGRLLIFPLGARAKAPNDRLSNELAKGLLGGGELRAHLSTEIFVPKDGKEDGLGKLEAALALSVAAEEVKAKLKRAVEKSDIAADPKATQVERAVKVGALTLADQEKLNAYLVAQDDVIQVDVFDEAKYRTLKG